MTKIKIKKLNPNAKLPKKMTDGAAGFDLYVVDSVKSDNHVRVHTGVAVEIPKGHVGYIFLRSSSVKFSRIMGGMVGVIDSDYRGELIVNLLQGEVPEVGDRIAQLVIQQVPNVELVQVKELSSTDRGEGSFGSTDRMSREMEVLFDEAKTEGTVFSLAKLSARERCKLYHDSDYCDNGGTEDFGE